MSHLLSITAGVLLSLVLTSCNGIKTSNTKHSPNTASDRSLSELATSLKSETACVAQGGAWKKVGLAQMFACVLPTSDAGKACTDGSQCQVACILKGTDVRPGTNVTGQCNDSTNEFGCRTYVRNGKAEATLCID